LSAISFVSFQNSSSSCEWSLYTYRSADLRLEIQVVFVEWFILFPRVLADLCWQVVRYCWPVIGYIYQSVYVDC